MRKRRPDRFASHNGNNTRREARNCFVRLVIVPLLAAACALTLGACAASMGPHRLEVAEIGSFHVGGRPVSLTGLPKREFSSTVGMAPYVVDPNGDFEVEQMYAQFVQLVSPLAKYPLLLVHGGGLTGVTWETKPDGRAGWQMFFLQQGWDVYVSDAVERGRSSWARYPEIWKSEPLFRTKKRRGSCSASGPTTSIPPNARPSPACAFRWLLSISS